jgi:hypothetical protein
MNRVIKTSICAAAGALMQVAFVMPAGAEYMGYANGDPGNWSYNTEQAGGPCNLPGGRDVDASTGQAKCCSQYNPMSMCPLAHAAPRYYRHPRRHVAGH